MIARDYERYQILFPFRREINPQLIQDILERGFESGWSTKKDGGRSECNIINYTREEYHVVDTQRAIEEFGTGDEGSITIFTKEGEFDFDLNFSNDFEQFELPQLNGVYISTSYVHWKRDPAFATSAMFDAAICLFVTLESSFAFSYLPTDHEWGTPVTPTDLEQHTIPDVFWITMLSAPAVDEIGRDRFDDLSVARRRRLDHGGEAFAAVDDALGGYTPDVKERVREHLGIDGRAKSE